MKQILTLSFIGLLILVGSSLTFGQSPELISVNNSGTGTGNIGSGFPSVSADGRYVAFSSAASDLVPSDNNNESDIFVRDRVAGTIKMVSVNSMGTGGGNKSTFNCSISANGRFVVFSSEASDLVPNDTNGVVEDVFVRDLVTDTTTLVSINRTGSGSGDDSSYLAGTPTISADGRFVTFLSYASNLVSITHNVGAGVYIRDMVNQTTALVSVNRAGTGRGNGESTLYTMSLDGRYVAFESSATNLVPQPTDGLSNVFVRDVVGRVTKLVSINMAGTRSGNNSSGLGNNVPLISANGRFVVFYSLAGDITGNACCVFDVYVRDMQEGKTKLVSINSEGTSGGGGSSFPQAISPDGRYVAFNSEGGDFEATPDNNFTWDGFIRDLKTEKTTLVSVNRVGNGTGNGKSILTGISDDGRFAVFTSESSNILASDPNVRQDIFVRDLLANTTSLVSVNKLGTKSGNGESADPLISPDGRLVVFDSSATDLVQTSDINGGLTDVFAFRIPHRGAFQFKTSTYRAAENAGSMMITVNRIGGSEGQVKVNYATSNGTAQAGRDYAARSGTLTFADGETSKSFVIPILDDALDEANETVSLTLGNPIGGAGLVNPPTATLIIVDNDPSPSLSINDVTVTEGNAGTISATFTVSLSGLSGQTVKVTFATANETAVAGGDYVARRGQLAFNPGQTTKTVTITVKGDTLHEANETFKVNLSAPVHATIADGRGIGTIVNDD